MHGNSPIYSLQSEGQDSEFLINPQFLESLLHLRISMWFGVVSKEKLEDITLTVAPKVMPPMLLCWPTTPEAAVGSMAVETEPSLQCFAIFSGHATYGSRGVVWQNGIWHGSTQSKDVPLNFSMQEKNGTHWNSLILAACLWRQNRGCKHSETVGSAFQQWRWHWVTSAGANFYECSMQTLVHCW